MIWPVHDTRLATDFEIHIDTTKAEFRLPNGAIDPYKIWQVLAQHAIILEKGGMLPGGKWGGPIASAAGDPEPVGYWLLHAGGEDE